MTVGSRDFATYKHVIAIVTTVGISSSGYFTWTGMHSVAFLFLFTASLTITVILFLHLVARDAPDDQRG